MSLSGQQILPNVWIFVGPSTSEDRARITRSVLTQTFNIPPAELVFDLTPTLKPVLRPPHHHISFNRSQRQALWALSVASDHIVGIDLEILPLGELTPDIAEAFFSVSERRWLESLSPALHDLGFAHLWTAKEAVLKAWGDGVLDGVAEPDFGSMLGPGPWPHHHQKDFFFRNHTVRFDWIAWQSADRTSALICRALISSNRP